MPDHAGIYREKAEMYHQLVSKQPGVAPILEKIRPWARIGNNGSWCGNGEACL